MNVTCRVAVLASSIAFTACNRLHSQTYGFVATLGNDTTSIERITRRGDHITSDAVGHSPDVIKRHWEADVNPDGTIRHWVMDTHIVNAPAPFADLHHELTIDDKGVRIIRKTGKDSSDVLYQKKYSVVIPWNAFVYGTWEMLFNAARTRSDTMHFGQYFFEGWDEGHIGYAVIHNLGNGRYSIGSTGLAGTGVGQIDSVGKMIAYSGEGTTYKQEVKRISDVPDLDAIAARFAADEKARGTAHSLSVRDTARATVGATTFAIDYSRPMARGRKLVGGLIPFDQVWRTGANAATQLMVSKPVTIAGIKLDSGKYTLWTVPAANGVQLIINRVTGQWGTDYSPGNDIARAPMHVDTLTSPVEKFTIRVEPDPARLVMEWGTFQWSVPITAK